MTTNTWTGLGPDDDWTDAANWSLGHVPLFVEADLIPSGFEVDVNVTRSIAGGFTERAGATLTIAAGRQLTLAGTNSLSGTVGGSGVFTLLNSTTSIAAGATVTAATWYVAGAGTVTIAENIVYAGKFSFGKAPTLTIDSDDTMTLMATSWLGGTVSGAGELALDGGTATITQGAALTVANWTIATSFTNVILRENLTYAGSFTQGSVSNLFIADHDTLTLTGSAKLAGIVEGAGKLTLSGSATKTVSGNAYIASGFSASGTRLDIIAGAALTLGGPAILGVTATTGEDLFVEGAGTLTLVGGATIDNLASLTVANWSLVGGGTATIAEDLAYDGHFYTGPTSTVTIESGDTLTLTGGTRLRGAVNGAGTLAISGGAATIDSSATMSVAEFSISGAGTAVTLDDNLTYAGAFSEGVGTTLTISSVDSLTLTGASTLSGATNGGALEIAGVLGVSAVTISGRASVTGAFYEIAGSSVIIDGTLTLTGPTSLSGDTDGDTLDIAGGIADFAAGAHMTVRQWELSGAATADIEQSYDYGGSLTVGANAKLTIDGDDVFGVADLTVDGIVSGAGELAVASATIDGGATMTVANWSNTGAHSIQTLKGNLTYAGAFSQSLNDTFVLSGGDLSLTGTDTFSDAIVIGSHILNTEGTTLVSGLTIGAAVEWKNTSRVTQNAGDITLGTVSQQAATLLNAATGIYDITSNNGIAHGAHAVSSITNRGLFEKTGGTGASEISVAIANSGTIQASSGTLELQRAVTGTGTDTISGASTLQFDASAASTQTIGFTGSGGTLFIGSPGTFSSSISDFDLGGASSDTIKVAAPWAYLGFTENGGGASGSLTFVNGGNHVSLTLLGDYSSTLFHANALGGNTLVTYG